MVNKNKPINQKIACERNKKVWVLKFLDGKIIDTFRQAAVAKKEKTRYEKEYFQKLILERDNSIRNNIIKIK